MPQHIRFNEERDAKEDDSVSQKESSIQVLLSSNKRISDDVVNTNKVANSSGQEDYKCTVCSKGGPFSARQRNRAIMGETARCIDCIDNNRLVPIKNDGQQQKSDNHEKEKNQQNEPCNNQPKDNIPVSTRNGGHQQDSDDNDNNSEKKQNQQEEKLYFSDGEPCNYQSSEEGEEKKESNSHVDPSGSTSKESRHGISKRKKPKQTKTKSLFSPGGSDGEKDDDESDVDVSLDALKRKVLGRDLRKSDASDYMDASEVVPVDIPSNMTDLRREFTCAVCHEIFHQPISLYCGHSFCSECFRWWVEHSQPASQQRDEQQEEEEELLGNCPTCRREILCDVNLVEVNTSLRACVLSLFGDEVKARAQADKEAKIKMTKGEDGGAHSFGHQVISEIKEEPYSKLTVGTTHILVRRSIVLDADDQRMQLALALRSNNMHLTDKDVMEIEMCLVTMEEDEASDTGFPLIIDDDNPDDEHLILNDGRFLSSSIEVKTNVDGREIPIARRSLRQETVQFRVDLGSQELQNATVVSFLHDETGAEFEVMVERAKKATMSVGGGVKGSSSNAMRTTKNRYVASIDFSSDEGENEDEFEDDGFVVADEDMENESGDEDESVDDDETDECDICGDGGELLICDGGDHMKGCGKSFHLKCIERDVVPPGDWICEKCANAFQLDVGIEGHEFDVDENEDNNRSSPERKEPPKRKMINLEDTSDDDDDEEEESAMNEGIRSQKNNANNVGSGSDNETKKRENTKRRRHILDDSDSDGE